MAETEASTALVPVKVEGVTDSQSKEQHSEPGVVARTYAQMDRESKRLTLALLTTVMPALVAQLAVGNLLLTMAIFSVPFLAWGIRAVPRYHNGLLSILWVKRTRIGFYEGIVWVPWFLGGRLQYLDIRRRMHDMPKEDNWTTDSMHLIYDIVLQFGIAKVEEEGFFRNFFQFFIYLFQRRPNAAGLYNFTNLEDLKSAVKTMGSIAADLTIRAVNSRGFAEIFQQREDGGLRLKDETIQQEVIVQLNQELEDMGLIVYKFNLRDIDFHEDTARVLQKKFLAVIEGEARERLFAKLAEAAKKLVAEGREVTEAALRIETIEAFKRASANDGVIGLFMQVLAAQKALPMVES